MIFIDRINELKALNNRYNSGKAEFKVIYGRRRLGKTELMKQFMNNHDGIIFTMREESEKIQLNRFSKGLSDIQKYCYYFLALIISIKINTIN